MGTPEFAVPVLQALIDNGEDVAAVVSQPDRPKGRGRKLAPTPVKILAQKANIPVLQPTKIKTESFLDQLKSFEPDVILVAAYGRILPATILDFPELGCINVHGSLLPQYRGAAPVQWAILNGEKEAGITIMQMDQGLDTGDMLLADSLPIADEDTTLSLAPRLANLGGKLLVQVLEQIKSDKLQPQKQDDSLSSLAPPLRKENGMIDWQKSASEISCQIRGLDPWPTASTTLDGKRFRLYKPSVVSYDVSPSTSTDENNHPGTICKADKNGILITCGKDMLLAKEVQKDGSKRMAVDDFLRGNPLHEGQILE